MKTIKIVLILILAFYSGNATMAQSDHLEPTDGIFESTDSHIDYYRKIKKVLFKGMNYRPALRFLIIPSFTAEKVFDIEFDRTTKKFMLVYQVCDKNIWYNKKSS